jgi:O-antigen chain-terminating methyltransferase
MVGEMQSASGLVEAIGRLPEIYQQIFGHPELSGRASRQSDDRLAHVVDAYAALAGLLGRDLRVLDLGCAQGFFCHHLAARGAKVRGVDFIEENIAVCRLLAKEHPAHRVTFDVTTIEQALAALQADEYDLVLGLSIFHHMVCSAGVSTVREMIGGLGRKVGAAILEMALREEPAHWAGAQPSSPQELLEELDFVHELARIETHLSTVARPLYFASNRYWFLSGRIEPFNLAKAVSHGAEQGIYQGTRRYYINSGSIAKLYRLEIESVRESNIDAIRSEVNFLSNVPATISAPTLILHGSSEREIWLVREYVAGELLYELIVGKNPFDASVVLRDVLSYLVLLEDAGLYHSDVRTWNVLVDRGRGTLIDFGAISRCARDCAWPQDIFLSFLIFAREVFGKEVGRTTPTRSPWFDVDALPDPYRGAFWSLLRSPPHTWSFRQLYRSIAEPGDIPEFKFEDNAGIAKLLKAVEESSRAYAQELAAHAAELAASRNHVIEQVSLLQREVPLRQEQVEKLGAALTSSRQQREVAQSEILLRRQQVGDLGQGLAVAQEQNRIARDEILLRRQQVENLGAALASLKEQREAAQDEILLRRRQVNDLGQGLAMAQEQNRIGEAEITRLRQQVNDLRNTLDLVQARGRATEQELAVGGEQVEDARREAAGLIARARQAESELAGIRQSRAFRFAQRLSRIAAIRNKRGTT